MARPITRPDDGIIDEIAIERRMRGEKRVPLTPAERVELVRRWVAGGRSCASCEKVTGLNVRRYLSTRVHNAVENQSLERR